MNNKFNVSDRVIVPAGRKCRQKARKLAKQKPYVNIFAFSKARNPVYFCFYDSYTGNYHEFIHGIENFLNILNKDQKSDSLKFHNHKMKEVSCDIYDTGNHEILSVPRFNR